MQFMYLRRAGKTKNPGNHPFGMLGVKMNPDGNSFVVQTAITVSGDRFEKFVGREIIKHKFNTLACIPMARFITKEMAANQSEALRFVLNKSVYNRITDKTRANEIFKSLLADEIANNSREAVRENGCAP